MAQKTQENDKRLKIPPRMFKISPTMIKIVDDEITICRNYPIEICEETANVVDIKKIIATKYGLNNLSILDSGYEFIRDNAGTRGEIFWNFRYKYYLVDQTEWNGFLERVNNPKQKKVKHAVEYNFSPRAKSCYYPVTMPKTFRRSFTLLKIINDQILIYKHLPFNLTDYTANLDFIRKQMIIGYDMEDPIILDRKYKEIRDHPTTRGELFWNTDRVFFFIDRKDWENFNVEPECKFHPIKNKKVNHSTYFDSSRPSYFKSNEAQF